MSKKEGLCIFYNRRNKGCDALQVQAEGKTPDKLNVLSANVPSQAKVHISGNIKVGKISAMEIINNLSCRVPANVGYPEIIAAQKRCSGYQGKKH